MCTYTHNTLVQYVSGCALQNSVELGEVVLFALLLTQSPIYPDFVDTLYFIS